MQGVPPTLGTLHVLSTVAVGFTLSTTATISMLQVTVSTSIAFIHISAHSEKAETTYVRHGITPNYGEYTDFGVHFSSTIHV